jgi:hypothetical protein
MNTEEWKPIESAQDAFDRVVKHLSTQSGRSVNGAGACCFLDDEGRKCAIGALMNPESSSLCLSYGYRKLAPTVRREFDPSDILQGQAPLGVILGERLTKLHDNPYNWTFGRFNVEAARRVAAAFGLDASVIDAIATTQAAQEG